MDKKASVLMITLWILAILVIFALGLGQRASIALRLVRYQRDRLKATYLAKAGINKVISILGEDAKDPETANYDTINACGVNLKGKEPKDIFAQEWKDKNEGFKIGYESASGDFIYGLRDEESRININGMIGIDKRALLIELLKLKNVENYEALADTILKWTDENRAEESIFKNGKLDKPEELFLILEYFYGKAGKDKKESRKIAQEVYNEIKDLITVYPEKININTASSDALKIIAFVLDQGSTGCAERVTGEIMRIRDEKIRSGQPLKNLEDIALDLSDPNYAQCAAFFDNLKNTFVFNSNYFRIESRGYVGSISKQVSAVVKRNTTTEIISWYEN